MALTTGAFLSDSGNPFGGIGANGDHYRDTVTQNLWFKAGGAWTLIGNLNDNTPDGVGTIWANGDGTPMNANGANGDYYRNRSNQDIWFKVDGVWNLIFGTTSLTSATSGVRSINGIQPDSGGDVTLVVEDLGGSSQDIAGISDTVQRGHKFGQFTRCSLTNPNGVYSFQSFTGGDYVTLTTTKLATISGGAAISDALYWNISAVSSGAGFALSTAVWSQTGGNVVSTRWQTGDKMQAIFSLTLTDLAPSPTNDFVFRVGFANAPGQKITAADVFSSITSGAHDGSAAYFYADNDSAYWKCASGHLTTIETTTTGIPAAIDVLHVFHVVIATNGAVRFYIDGGLVATHTTGVIASGKCLNESMGFRNRATTATANKGCILDQIEFRHQLANQRTGFAFV